MYRLILVIGLIWRIWTALQFSFAWKRIRYFYLEHQRLRNARNVGVEGRFEWQDYSEKCKLENSFELASLVEDALNQTRLYIAPITIVRAKLAACDWALANEIENLVILHSTLSNSSSNALNERIMAVIKDRTNRWDC